MPQCLYWCRKSAVPMLSQIGPREMWHWSWGENLDGAPGRQLAFAELNCCRPSLAAWKQALSQMSDGATKSQCILFECLRICRRLCPAGPLSSNREERQKEGKKRERDRERHKERERITENWEERERKRDACPTMTSVSRQYELPWINDEWPNEFVTLTGRQLSSVTTRGSFLFSSLA